MKLYFSPGVCSLSPHIVLCASGLPFTTEKIDIKVQPRLTAAGVDFKNINPRGYVPALELDNGKILTEGVAIVQYLADQVPEKKLAPANGTFERYQLQEWLNFIATEVHKGFGPLFHSKNDEVKQQAWEKLTQRLAITNQQLEKTPYLMGEQFTVADAYLFTCLGWTAFLQRSLADFPALLSFQKRVAALPFVQQALKAEGLLE
ncbi:glutathione transferase GstA [Neisseriaceae bacterium TC5R-5]|nr:glutathione transferase GstA [Neisseriaceae bacterium TC5R-5]